MHAAKHYSLQYVQHKLSRITLESQGGVCGDLESTHSGISLPEKAAAQFY